MDLAPMPIHVQNSWSEIKSIPVVESNETLSPIPNTESLKQFPIYFNLNVPNSINLCVARHSVIQKLQQAADLLPTHLGLLVLDAWRSREVQQAVQAKISTKIKADYPHLNNIEQQRLLDQFVAPASSDFISPHLTGGAVDVTLFERKTDKWLDMGADFDEPTERSYTNFYETQPDHPACANRRLLYSVMTKVGFSNLPTEWWHFDFGNALWADYYQQKYAIYGAAHWNNNVT